MGRGRLAFVAILMMAVTTIPQGTLASGPAAHAAVAINSDADWTAANGVVGGSGTSGDPFVIAGWRFFSSFGTALIVQNTSAWFVVRDNVFDGYNGLTLVDDRGHGVVAHNTFLVRSRAMSVATSDADVRDNAFTRSGAGTQGIVVSSSLAVIRNNSFANVANAIVTLDGNATIDGNDIHAADAAIYVKLAFETCVTANVITDTRSAIYMEGTVKGCVSGNVIVSGQVGITLMHCKDVEVDDNTIQLETKVGVLFETSSGNFSGNVVIDGAVDGVQVWHGPIVASNNTVSNNLGIGFWFDYAVSVAENNSIALNGVGILIEHASVVTLTANALANNTVGIDLRYDSRQTIPHMSANLVNGVNVDGTLVASEKVYYYHAANVTIEGGVRDSGFSAGYYGSLTAQGNVVLWEVDNARVNGTVISHATIGVGVYSAFNVVVSNASILQTGIGVYAQGAVGVGLYGGGSVPPCVVSVKDTNITIPVDPAGTIGVDAHLCLVNVLRTNVSVVDVGIRLDVSSSGSIEGDTIYGTRLGLDINARAYVDVRANVIGANEVGARFTGADAYVEDNHVYANLRAGIELASASHLRLEDNLIEANGAGVVDLRPCGGVITTSCSSVEAEGNVVVSNRGDGLRVNGTSSFDGDVFADNRGSGLVAGSATLVDVTARDNRGDGALVVGVATIRGGDYTGNGVHGLEMRGSADIRRANFTFNAQAGLRLSPINIQVLDANVSFNFDGVLLDGDAPTSSILSLNVGVNWLLQLAPTAFPPSPLDVHRSVLIGNERDAIRAGAIAVNATNDWFGGGAPTVEVADTVGAFHNGVTPTVRFVPWYEDAAMTTTGPVPLL